MDHLDKLENQSIFILREAHKKFKKLAMLWSVGKDSNVLLWLTRKAFYGHVPIPLVHIDTSYKMPEMIEFRDKYAKEWNVKLIVGQNKKALEEGMNYTKGRINCCTALKTNGLHQIMEEYDFKGLILGIRRDEESTRAKERYFSPRDTLLHRFGFRHCRYNLGNRIRYPAPYLDTGSRQADRFQSRD